MIYLGSIFRFIVFILSLFTEDYTNEECGGIYFAFSEKIINFVVAKYEYASETYQLSIAR